MVEERRSHYTLEHVSRKARFGDVCDRKISKLLILNFQALSKELVDLNNKQWEKMLAGERMNESAIMTNQELAEVKAQNERMRKEMRDLEKVRILKEVFANCIIYEICFEIFFF